MLCVTALAPCQDRSIEVCAELRLYVRKFSRSNSIFAYSLPLPRLWIFLEDGRREMRHPRRNLARGRMLSGGVRITRVIGRGLVSLPTTRHDGRIDVAVDPTISDFPLNQAMRDAKDSRLLLGPDFHGPLPAATGYRLVDREPEWSSVNNAPTIAPSGALSFGVVDEAAS